MVEPGDPTLGIDEPNPSEQIGPYHILELLGVGGMGEVYKAERRIPMRQIVALKVIKLGSNTRDVIARFESERQALARMDHPGIAKVMDAGSDALGRPYFVMEYFPGEPITKFADDNKLTIENRLALFKQTCDAIAHAHSKAIVHRDIKAGNVLACVQDGAHVVKIIDFGIAKALTGDRLTNATFNTQRGHIMGTYETMSPEQAAGVADIDERTDIYSLGVLLYELLIGSTPFDRDTLSRAAEAEVKRIICEVDPPRPSTRLSAFGSDATVIATRRQQQLSTLTRQLRTELEWIPLKALRKERERRYASARQFADDIQNYLLNRPLLAGPETQSYRLRKWLRRNRVATVISGLIALVIVLTSYGAYQAMENRRLNGRLDALVERTAPAKLNGLTPPVLLHTGEELQQAHAEATARLGANDPKTLRIEHNLATSLQLRGRNAEAEATYRDTLRRRRMSLGDTNDETLITMNSLGALLRNMKRPDEAEPLLREALLTRRSVHGSDNRDTIISMHDYGAWLRLRGRDVDAEPFLREAYDWRRKHIDEPNIRTHLLDSLFALGSVLMNTGRMREAEPLFKELYEHAEIDRGNMRLQSIAVFKSQYGILLTKMGRYQEAIAPLLEAHRLIIESEPKHIAAQQVLESLVLAYSNSGNQDAAAHWQTELTARMAATLPAGQPASAPISH